MTTYTGRTNPGPLAQHRRNATVQAKTAPRLDVTPLKEWPAAQRDVLPAFTDLLDKRIAQLAARQASPDPLPPARTMGTGDVFRRESVEPPADKAGPEHKPATELAQVQLPTTITAETSETHGQEKVGSKEDQRATQILTHVAYWTKAEYDGLDGSQQYLYLLSGIEALAFTLRLFYGSHILTTMPSDKRVRLHDLLKVQLQQAQEVLAMIKPLEVGTG